MQLARIERWYELETESSNQLGTRLSDFLRGVEARGGSIVAVRSGNSSAPSATVRVLCQVPIEGTLTRSIARGGTTRSRAMPRYAPVGALN